MEDASWNSLPIISTECVEMQKAYYTWSNLDHTSKENIVKAKNSEVSL